MIRRDTMFIHFKEKKRLAQSSDDGKEGEKRKIKEGKKKKINNLKG